MFSRTSVLKLYGECCKDRKILSLPDSVSKIVCVARNYSDDPKEREVDLNLRMQNASIFMKPPSSIASIEPTINLSGYSDIICETELALLIGTALPRMPRGVKSTQILDSISGIGLAFDLTRKDLQNRLKTEGRPWEIAKGFDHACPVSKFCEVSNDGWLNDSIEIKLELNGTVHLKQSTSDMILPVLDLINVMTQYFSLLPGDLILTGTPTKPKSPPILKPGDKLHATLGKYMCIETAVV